MLYGITKEDKLVYWTVAGCIVEFSSIKEG